MSANCIVNGEKKSTRRQRYILYLMKVYTGLSGCVLTSDAEFHNIERIAGGAVEVTVTKSPFRGMRARRHVALLVQFLVDVDKNYATHSPSLPSTKGWTN